MVDTNPVRACLSQLDGMPRRQRELSAWPLVRQMLDEVLKLPEPNRRELVRSLTDRENSFFFGIAEDAAIEAVRQNDESYLRYGLQALMIEDNNRLNPRGGWDSTWRDMNRSLCLLDHSAGKLGLTLRQVIMSVRESASPQMASFLHDWTRPTGNHSLAQTGRVEGLTEDGKFTYKDPSRPRRKYR